MFMSNPASPPPSILSIIRAIAEAGILYLWRLFTRSACSSVSCVSLSAAGTEEDRVKGSTTGAEGSATPPVVSGLAFIVPIVGKIVEGGCGMIGSGALGHGILGLDAT